jgi:hypothetical protein
MAIARPRDRDFQFIVADAGRGPTGSVAGPGR